MSGLARYFAAPTRRALFSWRGWVLIELRRPGGAAYCPEARLDWECYSSFFEPAMGLVVYQLSHIAGGLVFEPHRVFYVENVLRGALAQTSFGKFRDGPDLGHDCIHQVAIEGSGHATQTLQCDSIFGFRFLEVQDALPWFSNPCSHVVKT